MRLAKLDPPIDLDHVHVLGPPDAELTLVEYGSYACPQCHAVHEVIAGLRSRFGERMRYVGKSIGIVAASWLAVRSGIAVKPEAYSWRQLIGAGALGGIGFTMSLFIAGLAFPNPADYAVAKIAIFIASIIAAVLGAIILYPHRDEESKSEVTETSPEGCAI